MGEPEVERSYYSVRRSAGAGFVIAVVQRLGDGSGVVDVAGSRTIYPASAGGWRLAVDVLPEVGCIELDEALRAGLLTKDQADELLAGPG
jgi:hypothetical protein